MDVRWGRCVFFLMAGLLFSISPSTAKSNECQLVEKEACEIKGVINKLYFLRDAVNTCPESGVLRYQYAYTLERLRRYEGALTQYKKAIELDTDNAKYYFGLGDTHYVLGNFPDAIKAYEKGLAIDASDQRVNHKYVQLLHQQKKMDLNRAKR